jgi:SAM-dependent methyltransferase
MIEAGRWARTATLRVLSPADTGWRKIRGRPPLPPLWLRRHAGRVGRFESSASDCLAQLTAWNATASAGRIVDLGCGPGAMALLFRFALGPAGRYVGIDVHAPSIAWCRGAFSGDTRFRFEHAPIESSFGRGRVPISEYRLPVEDASADLVLAKSLFTHLSAADAERYLREIARILAPTGAAVVTAFLFGDVDVPGFPFGGEDGVRWRVRYRPAAATAFARPRFDAMIREAGLRVENEALGFYPGSEKVPSGQDVLKLVRA